MGFGRALRLNALPDAANPHPAAAGLGSVRGVVSMIMSMI